MNVPKTGTIVPKDSDNVLDLYNVDYVCKVEFVNGDFIVQKLEDMAETKKSRRSGINVSSRVLRDGSA